jgi:two-component system, response regulator, stage 0 sporulation protein A
MFAFSEVASTMSDPLTIDQNVTDIIRGIGVPAHLKGSYYVRAAILLVIENDDFMRAFSKKLYPMIAEKNDTTANRVERDIRNCIDIACFRGNATEINRLFGPGKTKHRITNKEFIATIVDRLKMDIF